MHDLVVEGLQDRVVEADLLDGALVAVDADIVAEREGLGKEHRHAAREVREGVLDGQRDRQAEDAEEGDERPGGGGGEHGDDDDAEHDIEHRADD